MEYWFEEGCFIDEWSNTALDPECSIAHVRLPATRQTRWHILKGTTERYVILQGEGMVEIGDAPARHVKAGDVVIIPAGQRQRVLNAGPQELLFLAICTPRFLAGNYSDVG